MGAPISTSTAAPASALDDRALALRPERATAAQATQKFEAYFVAELLKSAQRPTFDDAPLSGGSAGAMYRDMFADELAQRIAARGGLGLAHALERSARPSPASAEQGDVP